MLSKKNQTMKVKKSNPKRLNVSTLRGFKDSIMDYTQGICQLCKSMPGEDFHHPIFGCRGADKDDRILVLACRSCHSECHKEKHGDVNNSAVVIGHDNYERYQL